MVLFVLFWNDPTRWVTEWRRRNEGDRSFDVMIAFSSATKFHKRMPLSRKTGWSSVGIRVSLTVLCGLW